ncbi:MAG: GNAT family acetyltransferase [Rhodoferax sp.]|uniref:GNAT family acetyltransferase n=1 Tax=Rhodoferax sp. TaxID=50421 RepID=UPI00262F02B8|nr:GNAT family acetyltransferase [Rhodoferax sp.]MDD2883391.1 GNAT family acetyltransferase [Rhodoferax sp.]
MLAEIRSGEPEAPNLAPSAPPTPRLEVRAFDNTRHRAQVVSLWTEVFADDSPHNAPTLAIDQKLAAADGLFFVATKGEQVVGTIMAGYDGHRGWLYSVAVHPSCRHQDIGSALLQTAEQALAERGCLKVNLQVVESNAGVVGFYAAQGYAVEKRISMGKLLGGGRVAKSLEPQNMTEQPIAAV